MKMFFRGDGPIENTLAHVLKALTGDEKVASSEEADIVFCESASDCLSSLKQGKRVIQIVKDPNDDGASGLLTAPQFQGEFMIFNVIKDKASVVKILNFLCEKKEETP